MGQRTAKVERDGAAKHAMPDDEPTHRSRTKTDRESGNPPAPIGAASPVSPPAVAQTHEPAVKTYDTKAYDTLEEQQADDVGAARQEIEETRQEMAETIEAIKEQLSPHHLMAEAKESVRAAAVEKIEQAEHSVTSAVASAREAAQPTLSAAAVRLHAAIDQGRVIGKNMVAAARKQPVLLTLAGLGLGLLWFSSRRQRLTLRR